MNSKNSSNQLNFVRRIKIGDKTVHNNAKMTKKKHIMSSVLFLIHSNNCVSLKSILCNLPFFHFICISYKIYRYKYFSFVVCNLTIPTNKTFLYEDN